MSNPFYRRCEEVWGYVATIHAMQFSTDTAAGTMALRMSEDLLRSFIYKNAELGRIWDRDEEWLAGIVGGGEVLRPGLVQNCKGTVTEYTPGGRKLVRKCGGQGSYSIVYCDAHQAYFEEQYPQGWKYYAGDVCEHGRYVGGCGADYMCGECESYREQEEDSDEEGEVY